MQRKESAEISQLLSIGFLSDRLLLALDLNEVQQLAQREPVLVDRLARTLDAVIQLAEQPTALLTRQPTAYAYPPAEYVALNLVRGEIDSKALTSATSALRRIRETVTIIQNAKRPTSEQLQLLRDLLEHLAESTLEEVDSRRNQPEAGQPDRRRLAEWQKILTP